MLSRGLAFDQTSVSFGYFPHYLVKHSQSAVVQHGRSGCSCAFRSEPCQPAVFGPFRTEMGAAYSRFALSLAQLGASHEIAFTTSGTTASTSICLFIPTPPEAYFRWPFRKQVDWNIDNFLPNAVTWTRSWLAVYHSDRYDILLTDYSEIVRDEVGYIYRILDFYGIPRRQFRRPAIEKTISGSHFRPGLEDEWMSALTSDQVSRATAIIGEDLLERLGWPRTLPKSRTA